MRWEIPSMVNQGEFAFEYDALGNRIAKIIKPKDSNGNVLNETHWRTDYYVRDANGQEMAIYSQQFSPTTGTNYDLNFLLNATHLYGAARLGVTSEFKGVANTVENIQFTTVTNTFGNGVGNISESHISSATYSYPQYSEEEINFENLLGYKQFEISNHLGNVTAVVQDAKTLDFDTEAQYNVYRPRISSLSDYYPFGMKMPGRQFSVEEYRYGFNGMEKDDEIKGEGNSYTTHFRKYDSRIGRWLSMDPLMAQYPNQGPYVAFNNNPIFFADPTGLEGEPKTHTVEKGDTYSKVASLYDVTIDNLRKWNSAGGFDDYNIPIGYELIVSDPLKGENRSRSQLMKRRQDVEIKSFYLPPSPVSFELDEYSIYANGNSHGGNLGPVGLGYTGLFFSLGSRDKATGFYEFGRMEFVDAGLAAAWQPTPHASAFSLDIASVHLGNINIDRELFLKYGSSSLTDYLNRSHLAHTVGFGFVYHYMTVHGFSAAFREDGIPPNTEYWTLNVGGLTLGGHIWASRSSTMMWEMTNRMTSADSMHREVVNYFAGQGDTSTFRYNFEQRGLGSIMNYRDSIQK